MAGVLGRQDEGISTFPPAAGGESRRVFLRDSLRMAGLVFAAAGVGYIAGRKGQPTDLVWQLDPDRCIGCGQCAINCVLHPSAVKAVQFYPLCAMCDICTGYFDVSYRRLDTGAENQLCPTGALIRQFIADQAGVPRFEYHVNRELCIGCGKCVRGCAMMNGSLFLQVQHDRCVNCNDCSIARACPTRAFRRVPASQPFLLKRKARQILEAGVLGATS
ncbi:MAG: 4Fe-4S binding protein [Thermoguttaceae bacterium]|nr:4Fe-4S binding protein [Thermoguttaceae bacterium]MDW8078120.1 4Fe-4S binding protein [Thermoguttaceae bacterium]